MTFSPHEHETILTNSQVSQLLAQFLLIAWPVGSIYESVDPTSPATLFGGTWVVFGPGRVVVGINAGDAEFDTVEETFGAKTHLLTANESGLREHVHAIPSVATSGNPGGNLGTAGTWNSNPANTTNGVLGGAANAVSAHNNIQPSIVAHRWKRTA